MSLDTILKNSKELVSKGNISQAIKILLDIENEVDIGSRNITDLILISSRYNSVQEDIMSGIISSADANLESNRILHSFLKLLSRINAEALQQSGARLPAHSGTEGKLRSALLLGDIPLMIQELNAIISAIPYDHWKADSESIFHIIVYLSFKKIGIDIHSELHSAKGRCDLLIQTSDYIYVIELKLDGSSQEAINQINRQGYLNSFLPDRRKKIAIGISFSSEKRAVAEYLIEVIAE